MNIFPIFSFILSSLITTVLSTSHYSLSLNMNPQSPMEVHICLINANSSLSRCQLGSKNVSITSQRIIKIDYTIDKAKMNILVNVETRKLTDRVVHSTIFSLANSTHSSIDNLLDIDYSISCQDNYYGAHCTRYCRNVANMICDSEGFLHCPRGFSGMKCEKRICTSCANGVCTARGECRCKEGWTGPNCDECIPTVGCLHGYCRNNTPSTCQCQSGWTGPMCDLKLPECPSRARCAPGAQCVARPGGNYECICPKGFTGRHCDVAVGSLRDDCSKENLCLNGGVCQRTAFAVLPVTCKCPIGFEGRWCEMAVCKPGVCMNGGKCLTEGGEKLNCHCEKGWTGERCHIRLPSTSSVIISHNISSNDIFYIMILLILLIILFIFCGVIVLLLRFESSSLDRSICSSLHKSSSSTSSSTSFPLIYSIPTKNEDGLFHAALKHQSKPKEFKLVMDEDPRYTSSPIFFTPPMSNSSSIYQELPFSKS